MKKSDVNDGWEFQWGEPSGIPMYPQGEKKIVDLPYDFMIGTDVSKDSVPGARTGFYSGKTASYTKYLELSKEDLEKVQQLSFDGCFGNTKVVVNGHVAFRHAYGYTPFLVELNPYIKEGKNRVTVTVSNTNEPNTRWYSGAGLYRKIERLTGERLHIFADGIYTYTKSIEGAAVQVVETTIENDTDTDRAVEVTIEILDRATKEVVTVMKDSISIDKEDAELSHVEITIDHPKLWNPDSPDLYVARVTICDLDNPKMMDSDETTFGIRIIRVDAKWGLRLNGRPIKLVGGCIHHDNGIVGAAAFRDSEYRKVMLHKKAGFNALRFAHNPMSKDLLNACDEIGMLVIDEAFDVWNMEKDTFDFSNQFADQWERELAAMLLRDRNHPCVFMWSIGNEIPEQGGLSEGYIQSEEMVSFVKSIDSTRPVGGALCSFFRGLDDEDNEKYWKSVMENAAQLEKDGMVNLDCKFGQDVWGPYTAPFVKDWDVVGYNYLQYQYERSHKDFPSRVMCATESKPREFASYWADVKRLPYLIGDFEWTSMDYIGEAGIGNSFYVEKKDVPMMRRMMHVAQYPARTADSGDFDICGFEKPQLGYKKVVLGSEETFLVSYDPRVHDKVELLGRYGWGRCEHSWSWPVEEGAPIKVEVYSKAPEVEVFVNDISIGKKATGEEHDFRAVFETTYISGKVCAVSYDEDGNEISRDEVCTVGKPVGIRILEDEILEELRDMGVLPLDEESVSYKVIEAVDENGNFVPYAEMKVTSEELGLQNVIALGSGRPTTEENYTSGEITTYRGRALAVVK